MKTLKLLKNSLFLILAMSLITIISCKKAATSSSNEAEELNAATAISNDDASTDAIFNTVYDDVMGADNEVGMTGIGLTGRTSETSRTDSLGGYSCLTITRQRLNAPAPFPVKITYDFGNGCVGANGKFRKGKIITIYTGRLIVPGSIATTTFENYQIDSFKVEGIHTIKNTSSALVPQFEITLRNGKLTNVNNGNYFTRVANHVFTQISGQGTPAFPLDDVLEITGFAQGSNTRSGVTNNWKRTILNIEPLIKRHNCNWLVKGKLRLERTGRPDAILDYGNGNCDNQATLTVGGLTRVITLP
jgi:hypothetical protein